MKQSEDAHACHVTPANGAIHIGTAWDGLFISVWAFGDASNKIDRTLSTLFVQFLELNEGHMEHYPAKGIESCI